MKNSLMEDHVIAVYSFSLYVVTWMMSCVFYVVTWMMSCVFLMVLLNFKVELQSYHNFSLIGQFGMAKTLELIAQEYWGPSLYHIVKTF